MPGDDSIIARHVDIAAIDSDPYTSEDVASEPKYSGCSCSNTSNLPIAEARSSESAIARETATSMGLQAASAQTQKVAQRVGLNEASVESEGTLQEAALMLGTYLTPSLYARYGIGLFDAANSFQLAYSLSKHWKVEAETSEQNRAGIIYSIEP